MSDLISREAILKHIDKVRQGAHMMDDIRRASIIMMGMDLGEEAVRNQPFAQPERRPLTEDDYAYCAECDPEVKCLSCGHRIAERPFEVYCNIMCKWVNEKDCCTMFEPRQGKMRKTEAQI